MRGLGWAVPLGPSVGITDLLLGHQQLLGSYWELESCAVPMVAALEMSVPHEPFSTFSPCLLRGLCFAGIKAVLCCLWVLQKLWLEKPGGGRLAMCRDVLSRGAEWERCSSSGVSPTSGTKNDAAVRVPEPCEITVE